MTAIDDFGQSLRGLAELVGRLVESARAQKSALLASDLPGIEASRLAQEELLGDLDRAQASCRATLAKLKKSLNLPEGETMAGITTGRPEMADLAGLWRETLRNLGRLREISLTNRLLATRAVAFYRKVTAIVQPDRQAGTYADSGRLREAHAPVISRVI